jgi:hypothetical protein
MSTWRAVYLGSFEFDRNPASPPPTEFDELALNAAKKSRKAGRSTPRHVDIALGTDHIQVTPSLPFS